MKHWTTTLVFLGMFLHGNGLLESVLGQTSPKAVNAAEKTSNAKLTWPRQYQDEKTTILLYQPQIDKWEGNQLEARAAVALTPQGKTEPLYGVAWITARTEVDKAARMVALEDVVVSKVAFPESKEDEKTFLSDLSRAIPDSAKDVPLDHLEANLAIAGATEKANALEVKNDPPKIIFSTEPAILILIDGKPELRQVPDTQIMRVVNTRSLILQDPSSKDFYLYLMNRWVTGKSALGVWKAADQVPKELDAIKDSLSKEGTVDLLVPKNPDGAPKDLPMIYTNDSPTELIQSEGEPQYTPIEGTNLLYMSNTDNAVFMLTSSKEYYVLISGRWFKGPSLQQGPWSYVPGKSLPPDFAKIPPDSAKANVLVSVPGTPQANEAVIANFIPQTAAVKIAEAKLTVFYDGEPEFKDIDGTKGMEYAVNSRLPVILVKESKTYYCVSNGVWFMANAPLGPWAAAVSVPSVIYTIPVSSPIHYVTYVRIYGSTKDEVYTGYTPGYMGTCVSPDDVVVYGTGYYYPAYLGSTWVGYPPTYGYGASFAYGSVTGFAFGFAAGAIIGDTWTYPYWGPSWGYGRVDINTHNVYTNWRGGVTSVNRHYDYDAWSGRSHATGRASSFNPYTGRSSVGGYSNYVNRASGNVDLKRGGATYNPNTGIVRAGGTRVSGNVYEGDLDVDRRRGYYNTKTHTGSRSFDNNLYAGRDGNVYRRSNGDWQNHSRGDWQNVQRDSSYSRGQFESLNRDFQSRNVGQQRYSGYSGGSARSGYSGGGARMGGGRMGGGRRR
jgi:hypothetical protein